MAQSTGPSGGKPTWNSINLSGEKCRTPLLWEIWLNRFQWGMVAKHSTNPKNYYFADTLDATQIAAQPEEVDGKSRLASEQTFVWGRRDRRSFTNKDHIWIWENHVTRGYSMRWRDKSRKNEMKLTRCFSFCQGSNESESHWNNFMLS